MKSTLGLFGKVILVGIITAILLQVISPTQGVLKLIPKAKATYKTDTAKDLVADIQSHEKPEFSGDTSSINMKVGESYNLLDLEKTGVHVEPQGETTLKVEVTEISDQWDNVFDVTTANAFIPQKAGTYYVTYHAFYDYQGTVLETSKQYALKVY